MFRWIQISLFLLPPLLGNISCVFSQTDRRTPGSSKPDTSILRQLVENPDIDPGKKIQPLLDLAEIQGRTDIKKLSTYSREAYKLAHETGDSSLKGVAARMLGVSYAKQGNYGNASMLFSESYQLADQYGTAEEEIKTLVNLGGLYYTQGEWATCLSYSKIALKTAIEINDSTVIAATHEAMGLVFLNNKTLDSAHVHFLKAIRLYDQLGHEERMANAISSYSGVYHASGKSEEALKQLREAESIFQRVDGEELSSEFVSSLLFQAEVNISLGRFDQAQITLDRIMKNAREQGLMSYLSDAYRLNAKIDSAQSNFLASIGWMNKHIAIKDSLASIDQNNKLEATMGFYESKIKADQLEILNAQNKLSAAQLTNQRVILVVVLLALFILSLLIAELIRRNRQIRLTNQRLGNKQRVIQKKNQNLEEVGRLLMTQKAELENLNRTKDRWFGVISHDFRHPLTVLHGALDLIMDGDLSDGERKRVVVDIQKRLSRTSYLLDNLLFWAQQQMDGWKANYESIYVHELLEPVVEVVEGWAKEKNLVFETHIDIDFRMITDPEAIRLVIRNLLSNSIKYSFPGQTIFILAQDLPDEWVISVTDHGVGMTPEQIETIFSNDHHSSTLGTHKEKGSGLGLSLCRDFVNFLGGSLNAESVPGSKTTFTLHLPKGGDPSDFYSSTKEVQRQSYSK